MSGMFNFTQYYLVSTILPGFFNVAAILFTINRLNLLKEKITLSPIEWAVVLLFSTIITLLIGMLIEKKIFSIIKEKRQQEDTITSYDQLASWREKLINQVNDKEKVWSHQILSFTEKLMSEYYCLNNIIPGIVVISVILLLFLPFSNMCELICYRVIVIIVTLLLL